MAEGCRLYVVEGQTRARASRLRAPILEPQGALEALRAKEAQELATYLDLDRKGGAKSLPILEEGPRDHNPPLLLRPREGDTSSPRGLLPRPS